jgi:hypothetical protein
MSVRLLWLMSDMLGVLLVGCCVRFVFIRIIKGSVAVSWHGLGVRVPLQTETLHRSRLPVWP